jgi:SAM-dependent MidA family methyltransferase
VATWREATERALYGPDGFYRRTSSGPADHFRTSVHASPLFAQAIARLAAQSGLRTVVDIGAGRGELLTALAGLDPDLALVGVELVDRPVGLPTRAEWVDALPTGLEALVVANEWLDNVPVDVVEQTADGPRLVLVDVEGNESLGAEPPPPDVAWLDRWWPLTEDVERAEVGHPRDERWAEVVRRLDRGMAVAIDYAHTRNDRPAYGSLTAYREGLQVAPTPDGSCDITAAVALDSCAAAGIGAGAVGTALLSQREALRSLGVDGARPPRELAESDPAAYLAALRNAGEAAELTDRGGLGAFTWLVQTVSMPVPEVIAAAEGEESIMPGRGQRATTGTDW